VPLAVLNLFVVIVACWQAYQARGIRSEFSEAKYIGLAVFSLLQAFLTGIPVVVVVRDMPEAYYLILTFTIFILCMVVLFLIFLPKIRKQRQWAGLTEDEQRRKLSAKVRESGSFQVTGSTPDSADRDPRRPMSPSSRMKDSSSWSAGSGNNLEDRPPGDSTDAAILRHTSLAVTEEEVVAVCELDADPNGSTKVGSSSGTTQLRIGARTALAPTSDEVTGVQEYDDADGDELDDSRFDASAAD